MQTRPETRRERYALKAKNAVKLPVRVACINLIHEENVAFIIRAAACFGVDEIDVIGSLPPSNILKAKSGSTNHLVKIYQHISVENFLKNHKDRQIISLELVDSAIPIDNYQFDFGRPITLVVGSEEIGISGVILHRSSQTLYIRMPGMGYCLNVAMATNIGLYEISRQYANWT